MNAIIDFQKQRQFKEAKERFERDKELFTSQIKRELLNELLLHVKPADGMKVHRMQEFQIPHLAASYRCRLGSELYKVSLSIKKVD